MLHRLIRFFKSNMVSVEESLHWSFSIAVGSKRVCIGSAARRYESGIS